MGKGKNPGVTPLQKEMQRLDEQQKKALQHGCPNCQGELKRETIIQLRCLACGNFYCVEDLIKGTIK
ncbi:MAG: hypothetical protein GF365_01905 [Candidatus Buchananbacteria bacterium]|nr:hypothetical protein [Candidatus Buchananbacteria bacterium]